MRRSGKIQDTQAFVRAVLIMAALVTILSGIMIHWNPDPASAATKNDYGLFWYGKGKDDLKYYQADIEPYNTESPESMQLGCITPEGRAIGAKDRVMLNDILVAASQVYVGSFDPLSRIGSEGAGFDIPDEKDVMEAEKERGVQPTETNGGYPTGKKGYQMFLKNEKSLLQKKAWILYSDREIKGDGSESKGPLDYQLPNGTWVHNPKVKVKKFLGMDLTELNSSDPDQKLFWVFDTSADNTAEDGETQEYVASLIDTDAANPISHQASLPTGCILNNAQVNIPDDIGSLFDRPTDFVTGVITGVVSKPISLIYELVRDPAWQWTFWTPHSERGDLMWNIPANCYSQSSAGFQIQQNAASLKSKYCEGSTPLGFDKKRTDVKNQKSAFLTVAHFFQWMISGVYFILLFASAVLFIMKGNRSRVLNLMNFIPRLLLSILLTLFSGFLIGIVISFANLLVMTIFGQGNAYEVSVVNAMLSDPALVIGDMRVDGSGSLGDILNLIVWALVTFFFIIFTIGALARQIALIALIVLAPIAFLCIVNPSWQHFFNKWVRMLLVVAFVPVILAFILKISMSVNPVVTNTNQAFGDTELGILGLLIMMLTIFLMSRVIKASKNFIVGQSGGAGAMGGLGGAMSAKGDRMRQNGGKFGAIGGMALGAAGRNMSSNAENAAGMAALVPPDKILGGAGGGLNAAGGGGSMGSARALMGGSLGVAPNATGRIGNKIADWQAKRSIANNYGADSLKPITPEEYAKHQAYKNYLMSEEGGSHTAVEADEAIETALGGTIVSHGGRHFIQTTGAGLADEWQRQHNPKGYWQGQQPGGENPERSPGGENPERSHSEVIPENPGDQGQLFDPAEHGEHESFDEQAEREAAEAEGRESEKERERREAAEENQRHEERQERARRRDEAINDAQQQSFDDEINRQAEEARQEEFERKWREKNS